MSATTAFSAIRSTMFRTFVPYLTKQRSTRLTQGRTRQAYFCTTTTTSTQEFFTSLTFFQERDRSAKDPFNSQCVRLVLNRARRQTTNSRTVQLFKRTTTMVSNFLRDHTGTRARILQFFSTIANSNHGAFSRKSTLASDVNSNGSHASITSSTTSIREGSTQFSLATYTNFSRRLFDTLEMLHLTDRGDGFEGVFRDFNRILSNFKLIIFSTSRYFLSTRSFRTSLSTHSRFIHHFLFSRNAVIADRVQFAFNAISSRHVSQFIQDRFSVDQRNDATTTSSTNLLSRFRSFLTIRLFPIIDLEGPFYPFVFTVYFSSSDRTLGRRIIQREHGFSSFTKHEYVSINVRRYIAHPSGLTFLSRIASFSNQHAEHAGILTRKGSSLDQCYQNFCNFIFYVSLTVIEVSPASFGNVRRRGSPRCCVVGGGGGVGRTFGHLRCVVV